MCARLFKIIDLKTDQGTDQGSDQGRMIAVWNFTTNRIKDRIRVCSSILPRIFYIQLANIDTFLVYPLALSVVGNHSKLPKLALWEHCEGPIFLQVGRFNWFRILGPPKSYSKVAFFEDSRLQNHL